MASDLSVIESSAEMLYGLIHQRFITSRPGISQMAEKYELGHFGHCPRVFCYGAKVLPVGCSDIPGQETVKLFCPSCLDVYSPPNSRFQTVDGAFFGTTFGCLFFMTFPDLNVGGLKPPTHNDSTGTTSSPLSGSTAVAPSNSLEKNSRGSLSSSLTSQQPGLPPPPLENNNNHARQPEQINGVAPRNLAPGLGPGNIYEPRIYGFRVSEIAKTGPRMKWLRSRPVDVNELDECRIWAENQEYIAQQTASSTMATTSGQTQAADAEMADDNEEVDDGAVEDQDMEASTSALRGNGQQQVQEVTQRKKSVNGRSSKRHHQADSGAMVNGDAAGRSAVRVGDGG